MWNRIQNTEYRIPMPTNRITLVWGLFIAPWHAHDAVCSWWAALTKAQNQWGEKLSVFSQHSLLELLPTSLFLSSFLPFQHLLLTHVGLVLARKFQNCKLIHEIRLVPQPGLLDCSGASDNGISASIGINLEFVPLPPLCCWLSLWSDPRMT